MEKRAVTPPSESRAASFRLRGERDAIDARYDPPTDSEDRAAYDAGYQARQELTP